MPSKSHAGGRSWAELLDLTQDPANQRPLYLQIYLALRTAIVTGTVSAGRRMPSTRALARQLEVSRTSVVAAYEQLLSEGYVEGRHGSGTFVTHAMPSRALETERPQRRAQANGVLSANGQRYLQLAPALAPKEPLPFATGYCSIDDRTLTAWKRAGAHALRRLTPSDLGYSDPQGDADLRREVAEYLKAARSANCAPEQVFIVSGAQQAVDFTVRVLLNPGDKVWIEDPGYPATRAALVGAGCEPVAVPVDGSGLLVAEGRARAAEARAAFITPSHQYPSGAVLSMVRRLELLAWAARTGAWIVEDDYDSEFRFVGKPLASLQGLDRADRVIYVGTLSKILFPGLRLGFAVVPTSLIDAFRAVRMATDRHPPTLVQRIVAHMMTSGQLASHIRRMRERYRAERDELVDGLGRKMATSAIVHTPECGMQLLLELTGGLSDVACSDAALQQGVVARPISPLYWREPARQGLLLGFTGFDGQALRAATRTLCRVIEAAAKDRTRQTT